MRRAKGMLDAKDSHVEALRARVDVGAGHRLAMAAAGLHTDAKSVRVDAAAMCKGIVMRIERPGMPVSCCAAQARPSCCARQRNLIAVIQPRVIPGRLRRPPCLAGPAIRGGYPLR